MADQRCLRSTITELKLGMTKKSVLIATVEYYSLYF